MPKIIIEVSGGVVQNVISNSKHVTYTVIDQDNLKGCDNSDQLQQEMDYVRDFREPQHLPALSPYIKDELKEFKELKRELQAAEWY